MAQRGGTDPGEGTSGLRGLDFIDMEAEVTGSEGTGGEEEGTDDSSLSDFFDETDQAPGNPMLLFQQQQAEEDARQVTLIKRSIYGRQTQKHYRH